VQAVIVVTAPLPQEISIESKRADEQSTRLLLSEAECSDMQERYLSRWHRFKYLLLL